MDHRLELFSDPPHTGRHVMRRATGVSLSLIERMIASRITVEGIEHVPAEGPVLFLGNHFTRFETFILPWLLDRHTKRYVHNLAHHELFVGRFGDFLHSIGARSTKEPGIKDSIVRDLITGRHDWVIYPEGSMIKDKRTWSRGRFMLSAPDRRGPPHTGAALMALQAQTARRRYLEAWRRQDVAVLDELEDRWGFTGANLPREPLRILPVTITYFPLRPGENLVYRMARRMLKEVPSQLEEELAVEGNLLLGDTDISVYLGEPIDVAPWAERLAGQYGTPEFDAALVRAKEELTTAAMAAIYRQVTVNLDHLFAAALRHSLRDRLPVAHLHRAILLAARTLQAGGLRRRHPSIGDGLTTLVAGGACPALDSIRNLAVSEHLLSVEDSWYRIDRLALNAEHDFHDVRLNNTLAVIANELEPVRPAIKAIREAVNLPPERLASRVAELLQREDVIEYREARDSATTPATGQDHERGQPFLLPAAGTPRAMVVAVHGYLAAPLEMKPLAELLAREGVAVLGVRLAGHGTDPLHLAAATRDDWRRSVERGVATARAWIAGHGGSIPLVVVGFSMGGLLAIEAATRLPVDGVVVINPPMRLRDGASHLVPAVDVWNDLAHALHLDGLTLDSVPNDPECPEINERRNPVASLHQLERLMADAPQLAERLRCPALMLQADRDPVVDPAGARTLYELLGSADKRLLAIDQDRHVVVRGAATATIATWISDFCATIR